MKSNASYTVEEATAKLEHYCAYQERCHKEVIQKLKGMNMIPLAIDTIVAHLIRHNYLNEERFAKNFARGKFKVKNWGKRRIIQELKLREISRYNLDAALKEINPDDYLEAFDQLARKKLEQIKEKHPLKRKKKLSDYLLYRGWESDLVYDKVNELID